jgi:hypothetical protein
MVGRLMASIITTTFNNYLDLKPPTLHKTYFSCVTTVFALIELSLSLSTVSDCVVRTDRGEVVRVALYEIEWRVEMLAIVEDAILELDLPLTASSVPVFKQSSQCLPS